MHEDINALLADAFNDYLHCRCQEDITPSCDLLPYDFDFIKRHQLGLLACYMLIDHLKELTNILNHWHGSLRRWHAWNIVIKQYDTQEEGWALQREFLEALAHHCLLQPSAVRDTISFVAINAFHQVHLASNKGYTDNLDIDRKKPDSRRRPMRHEKETCLSKLVAPWVKDDTLGLEESLRSLDDEHYRSMTCDYRNASSHCIGPRLGIGITQPIVRTVEQATKLVEQGDHTWMEVAITGKVTVSYAMGGTLPLDMNEARNANLEQYFRARNSYAAYLNLLKTVITSVPRADSGLV